MIGRADAPLIIDVRRQPAFAADRRMTVAPCILGREISQGVAATRRGRQSADAGHLGLTAQSAGLTAGFPDVHAMLEHGMILYDALYAWCRDSQAETHGWPPVRA
jgi:hypothetical protein